MAPAGWYAYFAWTWPHWLMVKSPLDAKEKTWENLVRRKAERADFRFVKTRLRSTRNGLLSLYVLEDKKPIRLRFKSTPSPDWKAELREVETWLDRANIREPEGQKS